jgi:hypothetical protein
MIKGMKAGRADQRCKVPVEVVQEVSKGEVPFSSANSTESTMKK